jgi:hypothetical protein
MTSLLAAAVVFAVLGVLYVINLNQRGGIRSPLLGALALATNIVTLVFAVAVGASVR